VPEWRSILTTNGCTAAATGCARRYGKAETRFLEALRLRPQDAAALFDLGFVRDRQGKQRAANEASASAVTLKPSTDRAWQGMGRANTALGEP